MIIIHKTTNDEVAFVADTSRGYSDVTFGENPSKNTLAVGVASVLASMTPPDVAIELNGTKNYVENASNERNLGENVSINRCMC